MSSLLYIEITVFCIIICFTIYKHILVNTDKQKTQILLSSAVLAYTLTFCLDLIWFLVSNDFIKTTNFQNYLINGLYFIQTIIGTCAWVYYSEYIQDTGFRKNKLYQAIILAPMLIVSIFVILSFKYGLLFYIDELGNYHRGTYHFIVMFFQITYVAFTSFKALYITTKKENYNRKDELITLAAYPIYPFITGVIQFIYVELPLLCVGVTLAILNSFLRQQERKISLDALTKLNNRNQFISYLSYKFSHLDSIHNLYLLMIDVDYFKKINDKYGHVEGDIALQHVAEALRLSCRNTDYFVARYGGDEFLIVADLKDNQNIDSLISHVHLCVDKINQKYATPYKLKLSVGHAEYNPDKHTSIDEFVKSADERLYEIKRARKAQ